MKKFLLPIVALAILAIPSTASATTAGFGPCSLNSHTPTFSYSEAFYNGETSCAFTLANKMEMCWQTNGGNGWINNGCNINPTSGGTVNSVGLQIKTNWNNFPCYVWTRIWTWGYASWRDSVTGTWKSSSNAAYSSASYRTYGCGASPAPTFAPTL